MSNVRPATVIVLGGLRARLRQSIGLPVRQLHIPIYRSQLSSASPFLTRAFATAAAELLGPQNQGIDSKSRVLKRTRVPLEDEEVVHIVKTAEPARLYELLRIEASHGDFDKVQIYAETLIRDHGEEPNLRMYSALILANSSTSGSIASVKDYVQQLRENGLDLDLGACHDIIKVGVTLFSAMSATDTSAVGFSRPSRLPLPRRDPRLHAGQMAATLRRGTA
jgi:hypothetical protein